MKTFICSYRDARSTSNLCFFFVQSDSLVSAIQDARSYVRNLNDSAGIKCCYLQKVKLSRREK